MPERTDHQLCMPELMAAKLAATASNGGSGMQPPWFRVTFGGEATGRRPYPRWPQQGEGGRGRWDQLIARQSPGGSAPE